MTNARPQNERRRRSDQNRLRWLRPHLPVFEDENKARQGRLAYYAAWALFVFPLLYGLIRLLTPSEAGVFEGTETAGVLLAGSVIIPLVIAGISLFSMALIHRGSVRLASWLLVISGWVALVLMSISLGGVRDTSFAGIMIVIVLAGLLLGGPASAVIVIATIIVGFVLANAENSGAIIVEADAPTEVLIGFSVLFAITASLVAAASSGYDHLIRRINQSDRDMRAQNRELRQMRESLEQRVAERTDDLNRRSGYLEVASRVAYAAGEILDVEELLRESVNMIRDAFGLYYVGLFLVEEGANAEAANWAMLRAGTGEAGQKMMARGHRIRIGEGMVGWAIAQAQSRFAQHAEADRVRLVAPELPETRAEAALPLRARGRVIGALTVQSAEVDFFDEDIVTVLQTMADSIAVALNNAELFSETELAMQALRRAYGDIAAGAWGDLLRGSTTTWGYRYTEGRVQPLEGTWQDPELLQLLSNVAVTDSPQTDTVPVTERAPLVRQDGTEVVIPMRMGSQYIGAVRYQRREGAGIWAEDDILLLNTLTDQLVQALDSARLLQETRRQAANQQQISEIAAMFANTVDVEAMLRTAVQELGQLPGVVEASVHLTPAQGEALQAGGDGNGDRG